MSHFEERTLHWQLHNNLHWQLFTIFLTQISGHASRA